MILNKLSRWKKKFDFSGPMSREPELQTWCNPAFLLRRHFQNYSGFSLRFIYSWSFSFRFFMDLIFTYPEFFKKVFWFFRAREGKVWRRQRLLWDLKPRNRVYSHENSYYLLERLLPSPMWIYFRTSPDFFTSIFDKWVFSSFSKFISGAPGFQRAQFRIMRAISVD